ncbi:MAG TPA: PVC-type heme-binding CxxCH protein [Pirellulales bacterium]|nr:PVC-type heme-binding CxxCH protein [Pirellulales bacterium]
MTRACPALVLALIISCQVRAADGPIPHGQQKPPGPPLAPAEAIAKMTVPEGFSVELVASEPDIVNPVAMTFDERGRIWITESLEYPRREAGAGRDRVKVLEDTDGDGRADRFTVFAEGLNIPSGVAVGAGGVWVANAPDLLFMQDTDGDGRADRHEVVVTGFGRFDTHELPNSLTWGPDGWLYGLNGVFNPSHIEYRGKTFDFTCALFRIHPRTRDFELFAEGTSNPWGVAFDTEGSAFVSACVIDHLWHLTETGYYHRQGGPYPPFTWKLDSIVKHRHQQAAYCGIHYFDSDAYPERFRERLYMGNIHGNCINSDTLARDGSTYFATPNDDFLSANDAWFMPVVQKTGPDGCLYVLDWYDRYHCYQDANRDPQGIDRLKGRLYRVRYKDTPRSGQFDLAKETDDQLIERLRSPNVFYRDLAQRLLWERRTPETLGKLRRLVLDGDEPRKARMHALWSLIGAGPLDVDFHEQLLAQPDPTFRAWGVRAAGNQREVDARVRERVVALASDSSPDVRLQVAIAARKLAGVDSMDLLYRILIGAGDDRLIPQIVWQNLHPLLENESEKLLAHIKRTRLSEQPKLAMLMPRIVERVLGRANFDPRPVTMLLDALLANDGADPALAGQCLAMLAGKIETREIAGARLDKLRAALDPIADRLLGSSNPALVFNAALLAATWKEPRAVAVVRKTFISANEPDARRLQALAALVAAGDPGLLDEVAGVLADRQKGAIEFRRRALDALSRAESPDIARLVLAAYRDMEPDLKPQAIELLTGRPAWSKALLRAIADKGVSADALNLNQVRKLLVSKDAELVNMVRDTWGTLRNDRNPERENVIARMRHFLRQAPGDAQRGQQVFKKVCGQCHKIYGEGQEVGPDITVNGRSSFEQLLSNVFDPSLVIGAAYQARTVVTSDGRVITGLVAEDSPQRIVLKAQGGKLETIARPDIDQMETSKLSLMPENLEQQLKPEEIADLFAFITLDKPPDDPTAQQLPGMRNRQPRATEDPAEFSGIVGDVAPGFATSAVGEGGVAIVAEHFGRDGVLRTHPVGRDKPCILAATVKVPAGKKSRLLLDASYDKRGDWQLVVKVNGKKMYDGPVGPKTAQDGWLDVSVDLSSYAGTTVAIELLNQANGWSWEFGYWDRVRVVSQ